MKEKVLEISWSKENKAQEGFKSRYTHISNVILTGDTTCESEKKENILRCQSNRQIIRMKSDQTRMAGNKSSSNGMKNNILIKVKQKHEHMHICI